MTLAEIEKTISNLPAEQLSKFREWFFEFDAKTWDAELEADVANGQLDRLADQALRQHEAGKSTEL